MTTQKPTPYTGLFKRLLAPFQTENSDQEADDGAAVQDAYESVTQLNELMAEMSRLRGLRNSETARESELAADLAAIELQRIEALTEFKVSGEQEAKKRADALLKRSETISQNKRDCQAVAESIQTRIVALEADKASLRRAYQRDLGMFLDRVFARMCQRYTELAPELAEAALQMAAIQNVMMRYKAGNTNGFERRIHLPTVQPGNGNLKLPILDGDSRHFVEEANHRMDSIIAELKQAGFFYRFD